jgi:thioredoxin-related protein
MLCLAAALAALPDVRLGAGEGKSGPASPARSGARVPALEWLEYGVALDRAKEENKHVIIDFYTNWCGWCRKMDRDTYGDSAIATYLRDHFLLSKVNAESAQRFKVGTETKSGIELAGDFGVRSFPATWFIRPDGRRIDKILGYQPPAQFQRILEVVHERRYEQPDKPAKRN